MLFIVTISIGNPYYYTLFLSCLSKVRKLKNASNTKQAGQGPVYLVNIQLSSLKAKIPLGL